MSDDEELKARREVNPGTDQAGGHQDNDWDTFDFERWGAEADHDGADGRQYETTHAGLRNPATDQPDDEAGWVSQGGILHWMEPGAEEFEKPSDARTEAKSRWASDSIDLPPGAPDNLRLRSLRAWLLRQRLVETEALGELLLERRQLAASHEESEDSPPVSEVTEDSPLELELTTRQAAIEVYEALVESLDEMATHSGPARVLVEYYLWLNERLALLIATAPAQLDVSSFPMLAPLDSVDESASSAEAHQSESPATAHSIAQWQGRLQAALQTRRRIEQVSTPEPED
ncbi:MAG: hypothetical protein ACLQUY_07865 [Ktedonobacterales bacterium]